MAILNRILIIVIISLSGTIQCQDLEDKLVGFYRFNNNLIDESPFSILGIENNTTEDLGIEQVNATAYNFNGVSSYIDLGTNNRNITNELTISVWVKTSDQKRQFVVGKYSSSEDKGFFLSVENGKAIMGGRIGCGSFFQCTSSSNLDDGNWHHIVGSIINNNWTISIDCIPEDQIQSNCNNPTLSNNEKMTVGLWNEGLTFNKPRYFNGTIDHLRIYNRQLSTEEIGLLNNESPLFNQSCSDCLGTPNGSAIVDDCGECLLPSDPLFNQTCSDCLGTPNGSAIVDDCGECLLPSDPLFNQTCSDCLGTPNGSAIVDDCGECLLPSDPLFNQSCSDCLGTPNGSAIVDDCGECLLPSDPFFNQCTDCSIYIPNTITLTKNNENSIFRIFTCQDINPSIAVFIYDRWGNLVLNEESIKIIDFEWEGIYLHNILQPGTYAYKIMITGRIENKVYMGSITVLK